MHLKIVKCSIFFKFFSNFDIFAYKFWRYNFFYKTILFQNRKKMLIYLVLFCLTCILNMLHPDYQHSNESNSLRSCCFPDFTHSGVFLQKSFVLAFKWAVGKFRLFCYFLCLPAAIQGIHHKNNYPWILPWEKFIFSKKFCFAI